MSIPYFTSLLRKQLMSNDYSSPTMSASTYSRNSLCLFLILLACYGNNWCLMVILAPQCQPALSSEIVCVYPLFYYIITVWMLSMYSTSVHVTTHTPMHSHYLHAMLWLLHHYCTHIPRKTRLQIQCCYVQVQPRVLNSIMYALIALPRRHDT